MVANKTFRLSKLNTQHTNSYNQLTSSPKTLAQIAASLGVSTIEAAHRLSVLIDEGLCTRNKSAQGAPLDSYLMST
jgi:predicted ArsR family transcriptional regulator